MFHFGNRLQVQVFGQSHSPAMGVVMDNFPAGIHIDSEQEDEEVIMEFYNKQIKGNPEIEKFIIVVEDDEDYEEENECYGIKEYTIENNSIK